MFLLNGERIVDYQRRGLLKIGGSSEKLFNPTWYNFRFGRRCSLWDYGEKKFIPVDLNKDDNLIIPSHGLAKVWSHERFELSSTVFAIFGPTSSFVSKGLSLLHSPFVDPTFDGLLELAIKNELDEPHALKAEQVIGKITFFDIGDTYPIKRPGGDAGEIFDRRARDSGGLSQGD